MATLSDSKSDPTHKRKNPTLTNNTLSSATIVSSSFLKSVFLHDWWLIKAHGKGLAVGGFTSTGTLGVKLFCSSAISKRHDANTLETTDGITITISGFINRSQTHQHGFPSEVCNRFLIGFPYYWEEYAARYSGEESHNGCVPTRVSAFEEFKISSGNMKHSFLPVSLYDLPVTRTRDLLMSTLGDSEDCMITKSIFENLLGKFSDKAFQHTGVSNYSKCRH
ncbi:hypothetical protein L1049_016633 [Liquidambar formosana]|uniref:SANTA domain-containing protein n=1 Tax=Liquidambar formosana TaxID=63359 RepID=A0AAP0S6Q7_LIQFO